MSPLLDPLVQIFNVRLYLSARFDLSENGIVRGLGNLEISKRKVAALDSCLVVLMLVQAGCLGLMSQVSASPLFAIRSCDIVPLLNSIQVIMSTYTHPASHESTD